MIPYLARPTTMIDLDDLERLPDIDGFIRLTQSLATLDAILSTDPLDRYYSFTRRWSEGEMMASMRNGSGDDWFAVIGPAGIALVGLAHEAPTFQPGHPNPRIFDGLPKEFHRSPLREPAFDTANCTFCIWRLREDRRWQRGTVDPSDGDDGSSELLAILAGDPADYVTFANEYYERTLDASAVVAVYRHEPLTESLIHGLNPDINLDSLRADLDEIGYP